MKLKSLTVSLLVILSFLQPAQVLAKDKKNIPPKNKNSIYLNLNHPIYPVGMFSVFCFVAGVLHEYDKHDYAGIKIDFRERGLYFDKNHGVNWWNYYCEPLNTKSKKKKPYIKEFEIEEYTHYAYFAELELSRSEIHRLINKYIHIKSHIIQKVEEFTQLQFEPGFTLGVHYRGTDKSIEAPRIPYETVVISIDKYIKENSIENFKLFVASDEQAFVDYITNIYGHKTISYEVLRATSDEPLHFTHTSSNYEMGEQALIDCLLLSRCQALIRTSSNLSLWSTYFNPNMPVIELTNRLKK